MPTHRRLFKKPWVVYCKAPFAGPAKLVDYLSRYTHRVAISNHRILACRDGHVSFSYRDRRDGDRCKQLKLPVNQFIARFLSHVLPTRFMRIRHYGYLANRFKQQRLALIRRLIGARPAPPPSAVPATVDWLVQVLGMEPDRCPCCKGPLIRQPLPGSLIPSPIRALQLTVIRGPPT